MNKLETIELGDIDKGTYYTIDTGKEYNVVINIDNERVILKNVTIISHSSVDFFELYIMRRDQDDNIIEKLEKYKWYEDSLSVTYMVQKNEKKFLFQRIIMAK